MSFTKKLFIYTYNVGLTLSTIFTSTYSSKNLLMAQVIAHVFPKKMSVNRISNITHITVITSIKYQYITSLVMEIRITAVTCV